MRETDVAVVVGGLAGSTCAAIFGRAGTDAILIDPHEVFPEDSRWLAPEESLVALVAIAEVRERLPLRRAIGSRF